jgi:hypothetical protein
MKLVNLVVNCMWLVSRWIIALMLAIEASIHYRDPLNSTILIGLVGIIAGQIIREQEVEDIIEEPNANKPIDPISL